ncbi:hypothetical protein [Streptomyces lonarensis]|uniref:Uncharacterized protein n=2 Tax=Streptomyces lonarensis TaxID=700599 RepID=A0A7X6CZV6_9ACTN|nr:hypothetical protein [Streptomyces lonarensis]NJQ05572.1 hypothetical protein [Streptomyces lonarensis]
MVADGEFLAYTVDGERLALAGSEDWSGPVTVDHTGHWDRSGLDERLRRYWTRHRGGQTPLDPEATAALILHEYAAPRPGLFARLRRRGGAPATPPDDGTAT